jgi:hypothetical protein
MDMESMQFYKDHFEYLTKWWAIAASIGGLISITAFLVAMHWWQKCKSLWAASEDGGDSGWRITQSTTRVWLGR